MTSGSFSALSFLFSNCCWVMADFSFLKGFRNDRNGAFRFFLGDAWFLWKELPPSLGKRGEWARRPRLTESARQGFFPAEVSAQIMEDGQTVLRQPHHAFRAYRLPRSP